MKEKIIIVCLIGLSFPSPGQTFKQYEKNGDEAFLAGDHYKAARYFKKAIDLNPNKAAVQFKFATSSRHFNDYESAIDGYAETLKLDNYLNFPTAEYWLAMMYKYTGNYQTSLDHVKEFSEKYKQQDFYYKSAINEIENLENINELIKDTSDIEIEHLGRNINTSWSEFAASEVEDSILQLSSLRPASSDSLSDEKLYLSRIYTFNKIKNKWKPSKDGALEALNDIDKHIANGNFYKDDSEFFFTICEDTKYGDQHCQIFKSELRDSRLSQPEALGINLPCCTSTQPSVGNNNGKKTLYFASDRAGSVGGMDIWISVADTKGEFMKAENAGEQINTVGNEITPYFDDAKNKLYFSSDWHNNLGGYDIFYSEMKNGTWEEPLNAGISLNTSYNDIYFRVNRDGTSGYFASNRPSSYFLKGETCCNDIYRWEHPYNSLILTKDTALSTIDTTITVRKESPETEGESPSEPVDTMTSIRMYPEVKPDPDDNIGRMKNLLPVTLYFHNDEPDCCTMNDSTELDYKTSYQDYASLLPRYIREYSSIMNDKAKAEEEMETFFEDKVDQGMIALIRFTVLLQEELEKGTKIKVIIEGYCSPLAINPYNIKLAERRIVSLKIFFREFRKGILKEYLESRQLILKEEPIGEEMADSDVSDNPKDLPNSVYHPQAALERKVEIIAINVNR